MTQEQKQMLIQTNNAFAEFAEIQAIAGKHVAQMLMTYYKDLTTQGFDDELASQLVADYHKEFWRSITQQ